MKSFKRRNPVSYIHLKERFANVENFRPTEDVKIGNSGDEFLRTIFSSDSRKSTVKEI